MKTKIFAVSEGYFRRISKAALSLEREINIWLNTNPGIKIIKIFAVETPFFRAERELRSFFEKTP